MSAGLLVKEIQKNPFLAGLGKRIPGIFLVVFALSSLLPISPYIQLTPSTDSSVFLYIGSVILRGGVPYADVWDHKGPLIYYIDAFGQLLFGGSRWGVWLLEVIFIAAAVLIGFRLIKKAFGFWPSLFASILFLIQLRLVLDLGNLTEEYSLPLQFLTLLFIWKALKLNDSTSFLAIGVSAAFCFLLRPNNIGIPLSIGIYLLWSSISDKHNWKSLIAVLAGAACVLLPVALYFILAGAFPQLIDSVFSFNFAYGAQGAGHRLAAIWDGFNYLPIAMLFGISGWVVGLRALRDRKKLDFPTREFVRILIIALPIEIFLIGLTGRSFPHYYMSWLPALVCLSAFFIYYLSLYSLPSKQRAQGQAGMARLISLALLAGFAISPVLSSVQALRDGFDAVLQAGGIPPTDLSGNRYEAVLNYVNSRMEIDQPLLLLGNQVSINWLTQHFAPTRFVYQSSFLVEGYMTRELAEEVISELEANPPVIIDTGPAGGFLPALETPMVKLPRAIWPLYQYLQQNYFYAGTFPRTRWDLYLYQGRGMPLESEGQ